MVTESLRRARSVTVGTRRTVQTRAVILGGPGPGTPVAPVPGGSTQAPGANTTAGNDRDSLYHY